MSTLAAVRMLSQARYRYQDQSKRQLDSALKNYGNLETKLEIYHHTNGKMEELLDLTGTIPVNYRGSYYNIPIAMYLPKDFPNSPPICYVKPTSTMMIKQSQNVDGSGKVYLPYLADWKSESSDLLGVIQVMICIFGESPPVYQRPKGSAVPPNVNDNCPYPRQAGFPSSGATGSAGYPPATTAGYPPATTAGYPPATSAGYRPYPSYPSNGAGYPPAPAPPASGNFANTGYPGYPPPPVSFPIPASPTSGNNFSTVTADHIKASLISAIEEEVKSKANDKISQREAEIEALENTAVDLQRGGEKLNAMLSQMETDLVVITESKKLLEDKNRQFTDVINKLENSTDTTPNIEEAFGPLEPLYKQLLNSYAEENAITDAMHYLLEALQKGSIDLDQFLKCTRDLSRKQFMLRALMQKCRERAGLPY